MDRIWGESARLAATRSKPDCCLNWLRQRNEAII
jgi:hypothetical protein